MKKVLSLILAIITFIASITFLVMFCLTQRIDVQVNSQENFYKLFLIKDANEEFVKISKELIELYDLDDINQKSLLEVKNSVNQLQRLQFLAETINNNIPITIPLGDTAVEKVSDTSHSEIINDLKKWQSDTIVNTNNILNQGDSPFKKLSIDSKEYCDSKYRDEIDDASNLTNLCDAGIMKISENMKKIQMSSTYLVACIGYAVITIISLLIFIVDKNKKASKLSYITLIITFIFTISVIVNLLVAPDSSQTDSYNTDVNLENTINDNGGYIVPNSVSEWGFNNLNELGYGLVQITGYNLEDGYIYYQGEYEGNIFKLENGYYTFQKVLVEENRLLPTYTTKYEIVNNDSYLLPGDGTFLISKRDVITSEFVIFVNENGGALTQWYIPYSLIDWEKGIHPVDNGENHKYSYKLYLK